MVSSLTNQQVVNLTKLHDKKYRKLTKTHLLVEPNSINEALQAKAVLLLITTDNDYDSQYPVIVVTSAVMKKIAKCQPIPKLIAQVKSPQVQTVVGSKVLVLDQIQDPGNLGTILRTAYSLGISDIFMSEDTVDLTNPKVLRATQGAEFYLNFAIGNVYQYLAASTKPLITTFLDEPNDLPVTKLDSYNLVVGNEGNGINQQIKHLPHYNKKIPIRFESLNVAIATAIILYELR